MYISDDLRAYKNLCIAIIVSAYRDGDERFLKSSYCKEINSFATGGMKLPTLDEWRERKLEKDNDTSKYSKRLTLETISGMLIDYENGMSMKQIGEKWNVSPSVVAQYRDVFFI